MGLPWPRKVVAAHFLSWGGHNKRRTFIQPSWSSTIRNPTDLFLLEWGFRSAKIQNPRQAVSSGLEAEDYLFAPGEFADRERFPFLSIVVTDYEMPELNGIDQQSGLGQSRLVGW